MSMSDLVKPADPSPSGDTPHLVFLASGLVAFVILWAVPVAVLVWLSSMFFGSVGIAEALERTRGLAPTTYGGAFWLSVVITLVMVALEVRALLRGAPGRGSWLLRFITRPSTAYWVLILPTVLLVRVDTRGTDVPDILTTTLLLCCLGYVWFVLPLGVAAVAWRLTRWMWRKGAGSGFTSGVLGTLGLSFAMCTPVMCVVNDEDEPWAPVEEVGKAFDRGFDRASGQDAVDGSRTLMGALAEVLDGGSRAEAAVPEEAKDDRKGFPLLDGSRASTTRETSTHYTTQECMEALVEPEDDGRSRLTKVIRKLSIDYPSSEIEDLVRWKMVDICVDEPVRNGDDLFGLLLAASRNGLRDIYRHGQVVAKWKPALASYRARCLIDSSEVSEDSYEERQHRLVTVHEALDALHPGDRALIVDHYFDQLSYAEMARRQGRAAGAVAKATNRAVHTLRKWLANRCH